MFTAPQRLRCAGRCLVTESRTSQGGGHCSFPGISSAPRPLGLRCYVTFKEANPGALPTPHLLWFLTGLCLFPAASSLHLGLVLVTGLKAHAQGDSPALGGTLGPCHQQHLETHVGLLSSAHCVPHLSYC